MKHSITSLIAVLLLSFGMTAQAQLDNRQRTPQTVVTDGLAELPAKNTETYNRIVGEIAQTGSTGIQLLTDMLVPAGEGDNSKAEYAISGVVNHATLPGNEVQRKAIHDALITALKKQNNPGLQEYILGELNKLADQNDFNLYASLLGDKKLAATAASGLATMPGVDSKIEGLINNASAPDAALAYLAYFRKLKGTEPVLLTWVAEGDATTRSAAINALTVCGSAKALKTVKESGDTDSYLQLLNNLPDSKLVAKEAKALMKSNAAPLRCAGLRLILKSEPDRASKYILAALKDRDAQYRHTALVHAIPVAGEGIVSEVASKFKGFSASAKIDVLNWLGDNHADSQIDLIVAAVADNNPNISNCAIATASRIGGDKALSALIPLLGDAEKGAATSQALRSFNGDITKGVLESLGSTNTAAQQAALALAAERRISAAYPAVVALTKSADNAVSETAYAALKGVANADNFNDICNLLEASAGNTTAQLQSAAAATIANLSAQERYAKTEKRMATSKKPAFYYPLLAQAGTPEAVAKLVEGFNGKEHAAAYNALLQVNNPAEISDLFNVAAAAKGQERDALLGRVVALSVRAGLTPAAAYSLYADILDLNPGAQVRKLVMSSLAKVTTLPAAMLAAEYLSDPEVAYPAANALALIVDKNTDLQKGDAVRKALGEAVKVFKAQQAKGDADAGYAVDRVNLMLNKWNNEGGFKAASTTKSTDILVGDKMENFELCFDWMGRGNAVVTLRSMPLVKLSAENGISTEVNPDATVKANKDQWNRIYIRMINDRLFVNANGIDIAVNQPVNTIPGTDKKAPFEGKVAIASTDKAPVELRRFFVEELPATPVYELTPEEKAQGFELLFDGRSLENFHGNTSAYVPVDGCIYVSAQYGGTGNLYTKKNYSDFIFRFDFYFDVPAVNNGIGIRTGKDVTGVDAAFHGMEIQVLDHDDPVYQGYNYGFKGIKEYQQHGSVYGVAPAKHVDFGPIRQWHTEEIKAEGDHITVTVDGVVITDVNIREACQGHEVGPEGTNGNPYMIDHRNHPGLFNKEGYISFCGHGAGVKFRNVRVLDLTKNKAKSKKGKRK